MARSIVALLGIVISAALAGSSWAGEVVLVEAREFVFRPAVIRLRAGHPVTLRLVNRGQIAHQLEADVLRGLPVAVVDSQTYIEASGLDVLRVQPGAAASLRFVPRVRGRFSFACTIEGHQEAGMTGVLEIR